MPVHKVVLVHFHLHIVYAAIKWQNWVSTWPSKPKDVHYMAFYINCVPSPAVDQYWPRRNCFLNHDTRQIEANTTPHDVSGFLEPSGCLAQFLLWWCVYANHTHPSSEPACPHHPHTSTSQSHFLFSQKTIGPSCVNSLELLLSLILLLALNTHLISLPWFSG